MNGKRIVISTFGSFGDVDPYVAIALELKRRGHLPLIAASEVYREKMAALAIDFHPVRPVMPSYDEPERVAQLIGPIMDPREGGERVMDLILPYLREIYEDLNAAVKDADLLLTHPLPLLGPIVAQLTGVRWVSSVLAP